MSRAYEIESVLDGTRQAMWRDHERDILEVVIPGDGTVIVATGRGRRTWVELTAEQADELYEFLGQRRETRESS